MSENDTSRRWKAWVVGERKDQETFDRMSAKKRANERASRTVLGKNEE